MIVCHGCERHIFGDAVACPFCGIGARATITAAVLSIALAACGPAVGTDSTGDPATTGPGTTSPNTTLPGTTAMPTTSSTTVDPTTGTIDTGDATSSSGSNDDADDAPCAFYGCACCDFGSPGPIECDIFAQDCPVGEKCMPWANDGGADWNATRCSPLDDAPAAPGETCTVEGSGTSGIDDCELGAMCWEVASDTLEGTCVALCEGSVAAPTCTDPATACLLSNGDVLALCLPTCDPMMPMCDANEVCIPTGDGNVCAPVGG